MRLLVPALLVLLAPACRCATDPDTEGTGEACLAPAIDVASCDVAGLTANATSGLYNMHLRSGSTDRLLGVTNAGVRLDPAGIYLFNTLATESLNADGRVYFRSEGSLQGVSASLGFWACEVPEPGVIVGTVRRCDDLGNLYAEGTFEMRRLQRAAGEGEAQNFERVSELRPSAPNAPNANLFFNALTVADGYAYVVAEGYGTFVVDVRDPAAPRQVGFVSNGDDYFGAVAVSGNAVYLNSVRRGVRVFERVVGGDGSVALIERTAVPGGIQTYVANLTLDPTRNRLYAAAPVPDAAILALDLAQPLAPTITSSFIVDPSNPSLMEYPLDVTPLGERLYVSHNRLGLAVMDVADVSRPRYLGRFTPEDAATRAAAVGLLGTGVFAFEVSEGWDRAVRALDVTAPGTIRQVGAYARRREVSPRAAVLKDRTLYVAYWQDGLRRVDVTDPARPTETGYFHTWSDTQAGRGQGFLEGVSAVALGADGNVYVLDSARGLLVVRPTDGPL